MRRNGLLALAAVTLFLFLAIAITGSSPVIVTDREEARPGEKLKIEGSVPHPSTLFIRERSGDTLHALFPFRRRLPGGWLLPIVKEGFDRQSLLLVDRKER